ncbi:MAG TPA: metallopeptidase TldD-related protein [Stellaceae bacterium]|nr:metallopeptidase TldD-related protein [Stellaceae bacterium]
MTEQKIDSDSANDIDLLQDLVARARKAGADAADAVLFEGISLSHARRLGKTEKLERSEGQDLGLRVLVGKQQAIVSSSDRSPKMLAELVERTLAMARAVPEDPYCGLADPGEVVHDWPKLDMLDPAEPSAETLIERARAVEEAALAVSGITNSEGAEAGWGRSRVALAASNGFAGFYAGSHHSVAVAVIGGSGTKMERDYDFASAVYAGDLRDPAEIGKSAGERTVKRLGARKMATCRVPVVFDPRVARSFLSHLLGAISGPSIARGTSFLKDKLGQRIFPEAITITEDPHRRRGHRSRPFDAEGLANRRYALIDQGVLTTWLLDLRSARQLGLKSTGHATRGTASPPSPSATNIWFEPGAATPAELMADIKSGFYVTELMGMGVNGLTGDYSRGAAGFWIENGEIAFAVSEMTVAGNLNDMFARLTAANDLEFRTGADAPTLRIDDLTVAGA